MNTGNGSPLFASRWPSKCSHCNEKIPKDGPCGYLPGEDKISCAQCHVILNPWRPRY